MKKLRIDRADGRYLHLYAFDHEPPELLDVEEQARGADHLELRWNALLGEDVIVSTGRQERTFLPPAEYCPLCPTAGLGGFATEIPAASYEIAVFENRFPSFRPDAPEVAAEGALHDRARAQGACEVIVYTPEHDATLASLPEAQVRHLVRVWADRYAELAARPEVQYVFIFENRGREIGVTLTHPHGQIYAFPFVPPRVGAEHAAAAAHHAATGRCMMCDLVAEEIACGERIVAADSGFVAYVPFAARVPYEVHVAAVAHRASLLDVEEGERDGLARLLRTVQTKYDNLWGFAMPYTMSMHQRATDGVERAGEHLHIEFMPPYRTKDKLKYLAGVETGAGTYINDTAPEEKAAELRVAGPLIDDRWSSIVLRYDPSKIDYTQRPRPHKQSIDSLEALFKEEFDHELQGITEAPGRVNLIGEHVDYNDGLVLPFAINRSLQCAWRVRGDDDIRTYACTIDEHSRFDLARITHARAGSWANYVRGVVKAVGEAGHRMGGLDLAISGDVPHGVGLSSSAALEVALAAAIRDAFELPIDGVELARLCQRAENEFIGVRSGIMDQFASTLSERDHALLIDCRSLAHEAVPLGLAAAGLTIVITNSAVRRELVGSAYNDRRRECEVAVGDLRERLAKPELSSLRDVSMAELDSLETDTVFMRRARHVVTEIARVAAAVEAIGRDDFAALGSLMVESHQSLRDDYEVSSLELDLLVGLATAQEYVLGARLTGAGFGGCTVNLVRSDAVDAFGRDVIAPYRKGTGLPAVMYVTSPQDGLRTWRV